MIEQRDNQLLISFPSPEEAATFAKVLELLFKMKNQNEPASSDPLFESRPQDSQEPNRSRHTVLTDDRLEQLSRQRESGQTQHQRLLRAQSTLRDGVLPFSKPGETPQSTGQMSPRMKGVFADGEPSQASALPTPVGPTAPALPQPQSQPQQTNPPPSAPAAPRKTKLRPAPNSLPPLQS